MTDAIFDFAAIRSRMLGDHKPAPTMQHIECETCRGRGAVDESLGGAPRSGVVQCPDCNGWGFV